MKKLDEILGRAMTVAELIEDLQSFDPETPVFFGTDYGDICHTEQALPITEVSPANNETDLRETAYSSSGWEILGEDDEEYEDDEVPVAKNPRPIIVLR